MSAAEVLGIANALVEGGAARPAAPEPAPTSDFGVADDEYVSGAQFKRIMADVTASRDGGLALAADANIGYVRQQFSSDFARYGAEIDNLVRNVPPHLRTIDNLTRVVKMVRSDHIEEIASERAQQLVSTMEPTLRSNGAATPPVPVAREHTLESEKIPVEWKDRARKAGITERIVEDFCRSNDMTPEAFYKQFDTPMNRIIEDISIKRQG